MNANCNLVRYVIVFFGLSTALLGEELPVGATLELGVGLGGVLGDELHRRLPFDRASI
jgi:hypothetical protein